MKRLIYLIPLSAMAVFAFGSVAIAQIGVYDAGASMASLQEAGWQATQTTDDSLDPYTGVPLAGYLEADAPDGEPIDLEFYESPQDAQAELAETQNQEGDFEGTTVGNVLVYDSDNDTGAVTQNNLEALQNLLS
jgi:hypothetical protein